jgi:oligopeptide/dipeptide ABC transporter ATP-binding protein
MKKLKFGSVIILFLLVLSGMTVGGIGKKQRRLSTIAGVVPSLFKLPEGCLFNDRCSVTLKECFEGAPPVVDLGNGHIVMCHKYV